MNEEPGLTEQEAADVRTVAKGGATQIAGQISQRSISFFFTLAIANLLNAGGYGLYRKVAQILGICGQFGLAGFNYASMRFIARARATGNPGGVRGAARTGLAGAAISSVVVCGLVLASADLLSEYFSRTDEAAPELARLLRIGAPYVPAFALMQVLRYCTQAYKTMVPSVIVGNVIQPVVRSVVGIAFLLAGFGVTGAVTSLVFSMAIGAAAGAWYYVRMLTAEERAAPPQTERAAMVKFAFPQAGASLLGVQSLGLGVLVLGALRSNREVGLFGVALALQGPGGVFLSGIVNIWAPVVSDLHSRGDIARLDSLYKTIIRWIVMFSFLVYAALIIEPDLFVKFFGSGYREAATAVAILAVGNAFYSGTGPTGYVLSMTGRPGINFVNSLVAAALYVALGLAVVPDHGIVGMAIVDSCVTALVNTVRVVQARFLVGVQPFGRSILKPLTATAIGAVVLLLWKLVPGDSVVIGAIGLVIGAVVYLAVLWAFGLDPEERHVWDRIRSRAFRRDRGR